MKKLIVILLMLSVMVFPSQVYAADCANSAYSCAEMEVLRGYGTTFGPTIGASEVDADVATQAELDTVAALVDSDDELIDMFEPIYEGQVASRNSIGSYECSCKRDSSNKEVRVEVMVVGMAGSPTLEAYKEGKVTDSSIIIVNVEGKGKLRFNLAVKEMMALNTNDYIAVYKMS